MKKLIFILCTLSVVVFGQQNGIIQAKVTSKADTDGNNITNIPAWFVNLGLGTASTNPASSFVLSSEVGQSNGVCELDENGFIPLDRIPEINVVFSGRHLE
jgi:hypothetical protein